jgi:hypothetical protein
MDYGSTNNNQGYKTKESKMWRTNELILSTIRSMEHEQGREVERGGIAGGNEMKSWTAEIKKWACKLEDGEKGGHVGLIPGEGDKYDGRGNELPA